MACILVLFVYPVLRQLIQFFAEQLPAYLSEVASVSSITADQLPPGWEAVAHNWQDLVESELRLHLVKIMLYPVDLFRVLFSVPLLAAGLLTWQSHRTSFLLVLSAWFVFTMLPYLLYFIPWLSWVDPLEWGKAMCRTALSMGDAFMGYFFQTLGAGFPALSALDLCPDSAAAALLQTDLDGGRRSLHCLLIIYLYTSHNYNKKDPVFQKIKNETAAAIGAAFTSPLESLLSNYTLIENALQQVLSSSIFVHACECASDLPGRPSAVRQEVLYQPMNHAAACFVAVFF